MPSSRLRTAARWAGRAAAGLAGLALLGAGSAYGTAEYRLTRRHAVRGHALTVAPTAALAERGRHVATVRGCVDCHGENLAGRVMIDDPALGRVVTANLTNGRAAGPLTDADWDAAVRHGVGRDGRALLVMPSQEFAPISDEDLAAVAAYARSLPAVRAALPGNALGPVGRALIAAGVFKMAPDLIDHGRPHVARVTAEPTAAFGRYLAVSCTGCHGEGFGGGKPPGAPPQFKPAANLTPAGIGHYTEADFFRALREGRRPGGVPIDTAMPWKLYRHMDDTEIRAVYAYLRTLPPKPYGSR